MDAINARKTFEFINNIRSVNPETDQIYHFDEAEQKRILNESPWKKEYVLVRFRLLTRRQKENPLAGSLAQQRHCPGVQVDDEVALAGGS